MTRLILGISGSILIAVVSLISLPANVFAFHEFPDPDDPQRQPLDLFMLCEILRQEILEARLGLDGRADLSQLLELYNHLCVEDSIRIPPINFCDTIPPHLLQYYPVVCLPDDIPPFEPLPQNCGINPHAPPCNLPCYNPNDIFCQDDLYPVMDLEGENINMTVTITDNRTGDSREIRGSPNEVRTALFNETLLSQLNDTERAQALTQANLIIDDIVASQALWTSVDTSFEINYGPTTEPNGNATRADSITIRVQAS